MSSESKRSSWAPVIEGAVLIGLTALANLWLAPTDPGLVEVAPHPTLLITILILIRYGFAAGLQVALLGMIAYGGAVFAFVDVPTYYHLLSAPYATPVVILVPCAVVLGMLSQRTLTVADEARAALAELESKNRELEAEHVKLRNINVELADKVVGAGETLQTLYRYAKRFEADDVQSIYEGLADMLCEVLGAETASVWGRRGSAMKLLHRHGHHSPPALELTDGLEALFDEHGVLSIHDVPEAERQPSLPYLLGRIPDPDSDIYLTVDAIPFARYTPETIRLFTMVVDWARRSVGKAAPEVDDALVLAEVTAVGGEKTSLSRLLTGARAQLQAGRPEPSNVTNVDTRGLTAVMRDADKLLGAGRVDAPPPPRSATLRTVDQTFDEEVVKELTLAGSKDAALGELLGELGDYMERTKDR